MAFFHFYRLSKNPAPFEWLRPDRLFCGPLTISCPEPLSWVVPPQREHRRKQQLDDNPQGDKTGFIFPML
jgi:hypothetical protein